MVYNISFTKRAILNTFIIMKHFHQKELTAKLISSIVLFLLIFTISETVSAQDMFLLSFGKGKIQVRLYSNYFCGACRNLEPKIEYLLTDLIKKNIITITFIDIAPSRSSLLYSNYFLYIVNNKKEMGRVLRARTVLFEASNIPLNDQEKLEAFLQTKEVKFKPFDTKPVFALLNNYIREDQVTVTPTCIIIKGNKREVLNEDKDVIKALENLNQTSHEGLDGTPRDKRKNNS
jgi:hypothetical protein